eukprot:899789-Rhodomonas_salina.2
MSAVAQFDIDEVTCYAMSGADMVLSAYARAMRCPVLTWRRMPVHSLAHTCNQAAPTRPTPPPAKTGAARMFELVLQTMLLRARYAMSSTNIRSADADARRRVAERGSFPISLRVRYALSGTDVW